MVKSRINWVIDNPETALMELVDMGTKKEKRDFERLLKKLDRRDNLDSIIPTAAKFVRLTFHDCLRESNTGAGCNGCFNFHGVGDVWYMQGQCAKSREKNKTEFCIKKEGNLRPLVQNETDNNNLLFTGLVLEYIYKGHDFGDNDTVTESLFESGKSRADLWAFAGLVAVHKTILNNNEKCKDDLPAPCILQVDSLSKNCTLEPGLPTFRTGRADCVPSCGEGYPEFCTIEHENHPDPHGNGNKTAEFFADEFGLNVQEAVALLGAHSLGRTHSTTSMFADIPWTPQGQEDWNNFYYINGVNQTGFRFADPSILSNDIDVDQCNLKVSAFTGDEEGRPVPIKFRVKGERQTSNGGPWNWQQFSTGCEASRCDEAKAANGGVYHENSCCHWLEFCTANPDDCPWKLENFRSENFVNNNINMLNVDMGFVFDFETDSNGKPVGCPGLDTENFLSGKARFSDEVDCPRNDYPSGLGKDPNGNERTFFAEFQFYANNSQAWVKTFTRSYDMMLENGVDNSTLTLAPNDWFYEN